MPSPDNRNDCDKGLLDFCSDQDANANRDVDVQERRENAIRTLYPRPLRVTAIDADAYGVSTALSKLGNLILTAVRGPLRRPTRNAYLGRPQGPRRGGGVVVLALR